MRTDGQAVNNFVGLQWAVVNAGQPSEEKSAPLIKGLISTYGTKHEFVLT